jgi:thiamine biosynthesis lipoprotein
MFAVTGCAPPSQPAPQNPPVKLERFTYAHPQMGTVFNVVLFAPSQEAADRAANAAFARIDELNARLSDYLPDSDVSLLSKSSGSGEAIPLQDDLYRVLQRAKHYSKISDGAFDVTVGPYVRLWRRARAQRRLPSDSRLAEARAATGDALMLIDETAAPPTPPTATLTAPNMRLDLGAIAKGFAADEAIATLASHGITHALIDAGGDVTVGDAPPDRTPGQAPQEVAAPGWRVGIEPLLDENYRQLKVDTLPPYLAVSNCSVATSGDAFQHVVIDGARYSHIVNPKTGIGLTTPIGVTVIAPRGMDADALASTVSVLGPNDGLRLIEQTPDTEALVMWMDGTGEVRVKMSSGFPVK